MKKLNAVLFASALALLFPALASAQPGFEPAPRGPEMMHPDNHAPDLRRDAPPPDWRAPGARPDDRGPGFRPEDRGPAPRPDDRSNPPRPR